MKKIGELTNKFEYRAPFINSNNIDIDEVTDGDREFINWFFGELKIICPAYKIAWADQETYNKAKRSWLRGFKLSNMTQKEFIQIGLDKLLLKLDKVPSNARYIPHFGEFIGLCHPSAEDYNLKSTEMAFQEASQHVYGNEQIKFSHITIKHARDLTGYFLLTNQPRSISFPIFEKNYAESIKQFLEGKNLAQLELRSDFNEKEPEGIEKFKHIKNNKSAMEKMKEMLK